MVIKVTNYESNVIINLSLPLVIGEISCVGQTEIHIQNKSSNSNIVIWPVINGKFKALIPLIPGENIINFWCNSNSHTLSLIYEPLKFKRFIRLVYIKCKDDDGLFQAPEKEDNSIDSACKRIILGAQMLQTFTYDKIKEHNINGKTFHLEEKAGQPICHVFTSSLTLNKALQLNDGQLWRHFAVELMNSNLRVGNDCKFLAFLSFTRYTNNYNKPPLNHKEILQMTLGHVALGGNGLALLGSGCLHTWAQHLQEVPWRLGDKRKVDRMKFMDDSGNRYFKWACYSTGLGAALHELGHTFDLGHSSTGIMGRGFDDIYKYFIIEMFYYDHIFQKKHNPYYQESSKHSHTVSLSLTSPVSWQSDVNKSLDSLKLHPKETSRTSTSNLQKNNAADTVNKNLVPWRVPNPPEVYSSDPSLNLGAGGAFWTRSTALILYYHKWFNDIDEKTSSAIEIDGTNISSPEGICIVDFRDNEGTSFHHLEFSPEEIKCKIDLKLFNLYEHVTSEMKELGLLVEDSVGNIVESKINVADLFE